MTDSKTKLAGDIASASAVYGTRELANWLPAERHELLRELLHDLVYSSLVAFADADADVWRVPDPSPN